MKTYLVFITVLTLFSCNQGNSINKMVDSKINDTISDNSNSNKLKILGEWGIYVTIKNGMEANCNVCPRIIFQNNGIAEVIKPSKEIEKYNWTINSDTIIFLFSNNILQPNNRMFNNDKFIMTFKDRDNYSELEIKQTQKNYSYILRKQH